jgi:hypothetical protein
MTKHDYIFENLQKMCGQEDISINDIICYYICEELGIELDHDYDNLVDKSIENFKDCTREDHDLLWDLQPTIEDDEEHAFAVQHIRDIINIILGDDLC